MADALTFREYAERSGLCDQFGSPYDPMDYHTAMYAWEAAWKARPAQPQPQPAQPLTDARINAIADGILDHQRTSEKMPPLDREGFRELVGSAIAQWAAPSTPTPPEVAP